MTVIKRCKQWKYYLKNVVYEVQMITNYCNFKNFIITKILNKRKIKWCKRLSSFNLFIEYRSKTQNSIDDFFKRFDYESKKKFVTEEITKFDHIFDTKDFILCVVYDEIVDYNSSQNLNIKLVILQTKKICRFFFYSKIVDNSQKAWNEVINIDENRSIALNV